MAISLVTLCTNRKRLAASPTLRARTLPSGTQPFLADLWARRVYNARDRVPAARLYAGRGFREALATVDGDASRLWVASAGLGLVRGTDDVPPYDLTLSPSSQDAVQGRVHGGAFEPANWWMTINSALPSRSTLRLLVSSRPDDLFVLTLSESYSPLLIDDIAQLAAADLDRLRIVGSMRKERLPDHLRTIAISYDSRFDGPDSSQRGTRSDFPQRVTRHFVASILSAQPTAPACEHQKAVDRFLETLRAPARRRNKRLPDHELQQLIVRLWERSGGASGRILRMLRDEEGVACEQSRCARLVRQVRTRQGLPQ